MASSISRNVTAILKILAEQPRPEGGDAWVSGPAIHEMSGIAPEDVNDAVSVLVDSGLAEWIQTFGSAPYTFSDAWITARGRFELEKAREAEPGDDEVGIEAVRPLAPVGSPYGFTDQDWETASARKGRNDVLFVVFGYQFQSTHYDSDSLVMNLRSTFEYAVERYNKQPASIPIRLDFQALSAGYGGHLFNEIARDIISSDVAVFETSDQNPNVMIELGVALTWGVRVLPIKSKGAERPPSDISGQTWVDYRDSAAAFVDPEHDDKLLRLVERAAGKKSRPLKA